MKTIPRLALTRLHSNLSIPNGRCHTFLAARYLSRTAPYGEGSGSKISPRWLSEIKPRIGHCITFGLQPSQLTETSSILSLVSTQWRELLAGSQGYLTSPHRRSLFRREIVWGEQDSMGHVNNIIYNRYAEAGRMNWARKIGVYIDPKHRKEWEEMYTPKGIGLILKKITTEFKMPITWPDRVTVYHRVKNRPREGDDVIRLETMILSEKKQRVAALCDEEIVVYDYTKGRKVAMPGFMVDVLRDTWELQEQARAENTQKLEEVWRRIRDLEKSSWDRPDAVEM